MITLDDKANQRNFKSASITSWLLRFPLKTILRWSKHFALKQNQWVQLCLTWWVAILLIQFCC